MASLKSLALLFFSISLLTNTVVESRLTTNFYSKTCPRFHDIVRDIITNKQITTPTTAAAVIRLFFHDCFPNGCDASVLISSTPFNKAERDSSINLSLPGDGFDAIIRIKTALELACPNTVSCSDIISVATRDLLVTVGGPYYDVFLGRRDSRISKSSLLTDLLPLPSTPISKIIQQFESKGFTIQEMVALSGAHSIGFSHCKEFVDRVGLNNTGYNPRFASALKKACANYPKDETISVFNDIMTPNKFDNMYYQNIPKGLGLLQSDHGLYSDPRTRSFVDLYARDQDRFFKDFARAMQKLSVFGVMTGRRGEIRRRERLFNMISDVPTILEVVTDPDLTDLPDDLRLQILSFVPSQEAVLNTSLLSSRWKYLWKHSPSLVYECRDLLGLPQLQLITNLLTTNQYPVIHRFCFTVLSRFYSNEASDYFRI